MRLGSMLVGGILGAAATIFLTQNKKNTFSINWGQAGDSLNKVVDMAKNKMTGIGLNRMMTQDNKTKFESSTKSEDTIHNLDKVEEIVNQDPKLKADVDEIMFANKHQTSTEQSHI